MTANFRVILENCAAAEDIFWQVSGYVSIGAASHMEGIILTATAATFITRSTLNGRIYAQTAVALQQAIITYPTADTNCGTSTTTTTTTTATTTAPSSTTSIQGVKCKNHL
jgi:hypothetical protein